MIVYKYPPLFANLSRYQRQSHSVTVSLPLGSVYYWVEVYDENYKMMYQAKKNKHTLSGSVRMSRLDENFKKELNKHIPQLIVLAKLLGGEDSIVWFQND